MDLDWSAEIFDGIAQAKADGREPIIVLDLDGTIYNNAPRTLRILQEFAHENGERLPDLMTAVDGIATVDVAYKLADTLHNAGYTNDAVIDEAVAYWFDRFFTDEYVGYDLPTVGAVSFVRSIQEAGAVVAYLTGRDAPNMLIGTLKALQRDGFPVGTVDTRIILKDRFETADLAYKTEVIESLQLMGDVVAVFDNEPGICNLFFESFPSAVTFHLETSWAPGAPPLLAGIHPLPDFKLG